LYVSIATNFNNYKNIDGNEVERSKNFLDKALKRSYADDVKAHVAYFRQFMDRSSLDLGDDQFPHVTTDMRVERFKETNDAFLVATYFKFGRYLLICSSQPGGQPLIFRASGMTNSSRRGTVNIRATSTSK
jgi:alpha-L-fucosidase 2